MARKSKPEPTIESLQASILKEKARWIEIRKHGTSDPNWPDGTNLHLVRNHFIIDQIALRALCKAKGVKPCPRESKLKPPPHVSWDFCAKKSKAGPCLARRKNRK